MTRFLNKELLIAAFVVVTIGVYGYVLGTGIDALIKKE